MEVARDAQIHHAVRGADIEVILNGQVLGVNQAGVADLDHHVSDGAARGRALVHDEDLEADVGRLWPDDVQDVVREVPLRYRRAKRSQINQREKVARIEDCLH